jgi:DNA-binding NarL/FixJ family response regulator
VLDFTLPKSRWWIHYIISVITPAGGKSNVLKACYNGKSLLPAFVIMTYKSLYHLFFYLPAYCNLQVQNPINMLNIVIACDHKISRETILRVLNHSTIPCAVSVCADSYAAVSISERQQPEIVLIDGSSDPLAAIEATKKIMTCSAANVIAVSREADADFAEHMMAAGALGYLLAGSSPATILKAVAEVAKDNIFNCMNMLSAPVATPARVGGFRKSLASFQKSAKETISAATEIHWHGILKFTN